MSIGIILAGGSGSRMKMNIPKQFCMVGDRPVISYCLKTFEEAVEIQDLIIVAETEWHPFLIEWIEREKISKFKGFAKPGITRQHSIFHGLEYAMRECMHDDKSVVVIHDAARPCVSKQLLQVCVQETAIMDGAMPVLPVKDTIYLSENQTEISGLLERDKVFAGQTPESFRLQAYYEANKSLTEEQMQSVRGSSEVAYWAGMRISLVSGEEENFKITTPKDLESFERHIRETGNDILIGKH